MPYKNKEEAKDYHRKYMQKWRKKRKQQMGQLRKAIEHGRIDVAKQILETKPTIDVWGNQKPKGPKKKQKKQTKP